MSSLERGLKRPPDREQDERELVARLRDGDEAAFATLVQMYSPALLRLARMYVSTRAVAEDVVQETWLGVLQGPGPVRAALLAQDLDLPDSRQHRQDASQREARSIPFSSAGPAEGDEPSVDPDRFLSAEHPQWPGHWALGPTRWQTPEERLVSGETLRVILNAIEELVPAQREVITLRDIEGWSAEDVVTRWR